MAKGINVTGLSDDFYKNPYNVEEVLYFNYFDPVANSNKFYVAEVDSNSKGEYRFLATYGRVGSKGQICAKAFNSLSAAKSAMQTKVNEKKKKGYVQVDMAVGTQGSEQAKNRINCDGTGVGTTSKSNNDSKDKKTIHVNKIKLADNIVDLILRIYEEANSAVLRTATGSATKTGASPLGNLGINTINDGRLILSQIAQIQKGRKLGELNNWEVRDITQLAIKYYTIIPHVVSSKIDMQYMLTDLTTNLDREFDILQLYEDSLRVLSTMDLDAPLERKYKDLNCNLTTVNDETWKRVEKFIRSTALPQHHGYNLNVRNVVGVNQLKAPEFDGHYGNIQELFHGSRSANIVGILSSHLRLPNTLSAGIHKTGAMFGDGIYFASNSTKSANYSFGSWGGGRNRHNSAYLFIADVALGKQKIYHDACSYLRKAPDGYDSVWGKPTGHSWLKNHEYIIYRENQCKIKYIVEVTKDKT